MADHIEGICSGKGMEGIYIVIQQGDSIFNMLALFGGGVDSQTTGVETAVMQRSDDKIQFLTGLVQSQRDGSRIDLAVIYRKFILVPIFTVLISFLVSSSPKAGR